VPFHGAVSPSTVFLGLGIVIEPCPDTSVTTAPNTTATDRIFIIAGAMVIDMRRPRSIDICIETTHMLLLAPPRRGRRARSSRAHVPLPGLWYAAAVAGIYS
jgi:hypothetical protein